MSLLALTIIALQWNVALVAAPAAAGHQWSAAVYAAGSLICHQRPDRSFHVATAQLPVCARCFGLYFGVLIGVVAWAAVARLQHEPSRTAMRIVSADRARRALIVAAIPTVVSVVTASLGSWDGTNLTRAMLGIPLGATIGAVVAAVAAGDLR